MAEGYLKSKNIKDLTVLSRGIYADGSPVCENAYLVMEESGIDIKEHISENISQKDFDAELFITMSSSHKQVLLSLGIPSEKIITFPEEIPDPYGMGITFYRYTRDKIFSETDRLLFGGLILPFEINSALKEDIKEIAKLEKECFSCPWSENALLESMSAGTKFFVCKINGKTVGYAGISCVAGEGYITNIAVNRNYRSCGIGTLLVNRLLSLAREESLEFLTLEVRESNTIAQNLYKKFKFKTEGRRKNFYSFPNEDALIMTRRFINADTCY